MSAGMETPLLPWTVAARSVVCLRGLRPADFTREMAAAARAGVAG